MLTVAELFKRLSFGPLSSLAMGMEGAGTVRETDHNRVIVGINNALSRIYTRFSLSEKQVMITQYGHITNYHMDKRFALCNPDRLPQHLPYILDLPNEQFNNDVLRIIAVFDSLGHPIALNQENAPFSLFTPSPSTLQIPLPKQDEPMSIQYQAAHAKLEYGVLQAEIIVPLALEEALLKRTAYEVFTNIGTQEATGKAVEYLGVYEEICNEVEDAGHASILNSVPNKFHQRGFV